MGPIPEGAHLLLHGGACQAPQHDKIEAQKNQEAAIEELYALLADPTAYLAKPTEQAAPPDAQAEWDKLVEGADEDDEMGLSGILASAIGGSQLRDQARKRLLMVLEGHRKRRARERTPPRKPPAEIPMTPPATGTARRMETADAWQDLDAEGGPLLKDPYLGSPGIRNLMPPTARTTTSSRSQKARVEPYQQCHGPDKKPAAAPSLAAALATRLGGEGANHPGGWRRGPGRRRRGGAHWQLESCSGSTTGRGDRLETRVSLPWLCYDGGVDYYSCGVGGRDHYECKQRSVQIGAAGTTRRLFRLVLLHTVHYGPTPLRHGHTAHSQEVSIRRGRSPPAEPEGCQDYGGDAPSMDLPRRLYPDLYDLAIAYMEGGLQDFVYTRLLRHFSSSWG